MPSKASTETFVELLAINGSKGFNRLKVWDWESLRFLIYKKNAAIFLISKYASISKKKEGEKSIWQIKTYDKGSERTLLSDGSLFRFSRATCWSRSRMRFLLMLYSDQDIDGPINAVSNSQCR